VIWVAIAVAGALGAVARYLLDRVLSRVSASDLPWGTIVINVTGSFLAGLVAGLAARGVLGSAVAIVVAGGFLGAYTTFSTAMYEIARLLEQRATGTAIAVLVAPLVVSTSAASAGWWLGLG
jgi:fluoride exporter